MRLCRKERLKAEEAAKLRTDATTTSMAAHGTAGYGSGMPGFGVASSMVSTTTAIASKFTEVRETRHLFAGLS